MQLEDLRGKLGEAALAQAALEEELVRGERVGTQAIFLEWGGWITGGGRVSAAEERGPGEGDAGWF